MENNLIIPATKSLTVTNKFHSKGFKENTIEIGSDGKYKYYSYLLFDVSLIPHDASISYAELVLFKMSDFGNNNEKKFSIMPLRNHFGTSTTYKNKPDVDHKYKIDFYTAASKEEIKIDITSIVLLWIKNKLANKGIMLYGKKKDSFIQLGSSNCENEGFIPFIKVSYKHESHNRCYKEDCKQKWIKISKIICEEICKNDCNHTKNVTLIRVNVTGTVAPKSIYIIAIKVEITRADTGCRDKYYITKEYDNSTNTESYFVDKTYTIPVVPRKRSGDKEKATLYGAYRE